MTEPQLDLPAIRARAAEAARVMDDPFMCNEAQFPKVRASWADVSALLEVIDTVSELHVPWYEVNGVRHDHVALITVYEPGDLPDDHVCRTEGPDACMDDEHAVLCCYECRTPTDEGEPGYWFYPCTTARLLGVANAEPR